MWLHSTTAENPDQRMNIDKLRAYHPDCPAGSTIYARVFQNRIPVHEDGKKLRFLCSEIDQWLSDGRIRQKTKSRRCWENGSFVGTFRTGINSSRSGMVLHENQANGPVK